MFDDQSTPQPGVPSNLPVAPDDMFASIENEAPASAPTVEKIPDALSSGMLKKKSASASSSLPVAEAPAMVQVDYPTKAPVLGTIIKVVLILVLAAGAGFGGWWGYMTYIRKAPVDTTVTTPINVNTTPVNTVPTNNTTVPDAVVNTPAESAATTGTSKNVNDALLFGTATTTTGTSPEAKLDTDSDGLTDADEVNIYHTNPYKADTDGDTLSDSDEIKIWHTDPLNPDSDGDGHPDGTEVANGYNPLGPGKLSTSTTIGAPVKK